MNVLGYYFLGKYQWMMNSLFFISVLFFILVLQFFRYPSRTQMLGEKYILAPADGKVVVIERTEEKEYLKDKRLQVSIFMSPVNVHANWYPVSGKISYVRYHAGKYLVAWHPKASTENERSTILIQKENKTEILLRQIPGALAKRIVYYPHENDVVRQGGEMGFIKFGSRVDLFLPIDTKISVSLGQKTKGGVTIIGELA